MSDRVHYVVAYGISDDERRDDVSLFLSGYGPRVQLSVFEVELASAEVAVGFRDRLRSLIDPDDDQARLYRRTRDIPDRRLSTAIEHWRNALTSG
jgi:CRISPR-associated protein Cas2